MIRFWLVVFSLVIISNAHAQEQISVEQVILTSLQRNYDIQLRENDAIPAHYEDRHSYGILLPRLNGQGATVNNNNNNRTITASNVENRSLALGQTTSMVHFNWPGRCLMEQNVCNPQAVG
ncbi:MAG: hypothetical protein IPJ20_07790 [Flammeovirgaceae bacterium]|nr:hypothetical protein [Flammeovirgaceae bacterium]